MNVAAKTVLTANGDLEKIKFGVIKLGESETELEANKWLTILNNGKLMA